MEKITKSSDKVLIDPNEPLILPDGTALVGRVEWFLYALCCLDYQNLPTPMSRIEEFANALITGEVPNIEPQSRAEQFFLAILDGNVSNLPQPQSRSEVLLDKLARGEFDLSDVEPIQSSYELLLAYLIKNGGIGNIDYVLYEFSEAMKTMYNTVEKPFKSLELSGNTLVNCVLEDTENDDYTSFDEDYSGTSFTINGTSEGAIKSAILSGNTLVNVNSGFTTTWGGIIVSQSEVSSSGRAITTWDFDKTLLKSNTVYLISYNCNSNLTEDKEQGISVYCVGGTTGYATFTNGLNSFTFTTGDLQDDNNRVYLGIQLGENTPDVVFSNIMLIEYQEGMENWDIPYFEGMQSVKLPVLTTTGKNLFNGVLEKGNFNGGTNNIRSSTFTLEELRTYTISNDKNYSANVVFHDDNNQYISEISASKLPYTFTTPLKTKYVWIRTWSNQDDLTVKFQIEEGSVATTYEPYKSNILTVNEDITLRGVGNVKDELNLLTGELTQRVGKLALDGSSDEDWRITFGGSDTHTRFIMRRGSNLKPINNVNNQRFLCDKFKCVILISGENSDEVCLMESLDNFFVSIIIDNTRLNSVDVDGFKLWLQSNPITVQYQLATPTIKTVDLSVVDQNNTKIDKIHVFDEVTHVNASSDKLTPTVNISKSVSYPTVIKPNTKYTIDLKRNNKPLTVNLGGTEVTFTDGETRKTITTPSTLVNDKLSYYGIGAKCNEIMLIEGEIERNIDYFTGMQSVVMQNQMPILHTVGKNLFNLPLVQGSQTYGTIGGKPTHEIYSHRVTNEPNKYIKVEPNTQITFSVINNDVRFSIAELDKHGNRLGDTGWLNTVSQKTITTKSSTHYIGFNFKKVGNTNITVEEVINSNPMLEYSNTPTSYEPYKSSILSCNEEVTLRGIGDVQDTLDCLTGEVVQNIYEFILDGSQDIDNDGNLLYYYLPLGVHNNRSSSDKLPSITVGQILDGLIGVAPQNRGNASRVYINVNGITTKEEMKNFFLNNPTTIQCVLTEKSARTVDLNVVDKDGNAIPKIKSYKDVTHLEVTVPKQSLLPNISAEVATDNSKDMSSLAEKHQEISEAQSVIQNSIQSQSDEIDTALMATTEIFESILE